MYRRKDGRWEGLFIKEYHADGKAEYGYGKTYSEVKQMLSRFKTICLVKQ